jgi:hypothetical protein
MSHKVHSHKAHNKVDNHAPSVNTAIRHIPSIITETNSNGGRQATINRTSLTTRHAANIKVNLKASIRASYGENAQNAPSAETVLKVVNTFPKSSKKDSKADNKSRSKNQTKEQFKPPIKSHESRNPNIRRRNAPRTEAGMKLVMKAKATSAKNGEVKNAMASMKVNTKASSMIGLSPNMNLNLTLGTKKIVQTAPTAHHVTNGV